MMRSTSDNARAAREIMGLYHKGEFNRPDSWKIHHRKTKKKKENRKQPTPLLNLMDDPLQAGEDMEVVSVRVVRSVSKQGFVTLKDTESNAFICVIEPPPKGTEYGIVIESPSSTSLLATTDTQALAKEYIHQLISQGAYTEGVLKICFFGIKKLPTKQQFQAAFNLQHPEMSVAQRKAKCEVLWEAEKIRRKMKRSSDTKKNKKRKKPSSTGLSSVLLNSECTYRVDIARYNQTHPDADDDCDGINRLNQLKKNEYEFGDALERAEDKEDDLLAQRFDDDDEYDEYATEEQRAAAAQMHMELFGHSDDEEKENEDDKYARSLLVEFKQVTSTTTTKTTRRMTKRYC